MKQVSDRGKALRFVQAAVVVFLALYVFVEISKEVVRVHKNGRPLGSQGRPGSSVNRIGPLQGPGQQGRGRFQFTRKETECVTGANKPIQSNTNCNANAGFSIQSLTFTGESTGDSIEAFVALPQQYNRNRPKPYPVIFSLHPAEKDSWQEGRSFFKLMRWRLEAVLCDFLAMETTEPYIVVYPSGGDKCYVNSKDGKTSMAEDNVVKDLVPYIRQNFNVAIKDNVCHGMSMGAYGCILFGLKYPKLFPKVVVESPGRYPRFVPWAELIASEGPKQSPFSSRDYLLEHVFDEESYASYDLCTLSHQASSKNALEIVIFHGDKDPYAEQVDQIIGCLEDDKVSVIPYLVNGCGHGDLPACIPDKKEYTCFVNSVQSGVESQA